LQIIPSKPKLWRTSEVILDQKDFDFVIVGAGIIGTNIALQLRKRFKKATIVILEKEPHGFYHSSGRNSGVIHAGFYYPPGSLKAKMCAVGNAQMTDYCIERKLPILQAGKLVVARNEVELKTLDLLVDRGIKNGATVELVDMKSAREIEPRVRSFEKCIWSPKTSVADPKSVLQTMHDDARSNKIEIKYNTELVAKISGEQKINTNRGTFGYGYLVNAAGLHADKIAHQFGFGLKYRVLPFKGLYLYSGKSAAKFRTNIYPVPDLNFPFLGVHVTLALDGRSKLGPTAIPSLWREQYLGFSNFKLEEFFPTIWRMASFAFANGKTFHRLAVEEILKYNKKNMAVKAQALADDLMPEDYQEWGKAGIRAQLVNRENNKLEMDFLLEGNHQSMHVLNAVSPGWTCSIPFAEWVCDQILNVQKKSNQTIALRESEL
jgi:L-2-hydroxyglutarate oxidase LhgO